MRLTNRASAAGAGLAGTPCARSFHATSQAHKRNSSLLGRARQLQALVRRLALHESQHPVERDHEHADCKEAAPAAAMLDRSGSNYRYTTGAGYDARQMLMGVSIGSWP